METSGRAHSSPVNMSLVAASCVDARAVCSRHSRRGPACTDARNGHGRAVRQALCGEAGHPPESLLRQSVDDAHWRVALAQMSS